jgi:hypothetical protein
LGWTEYPQDMIDQQAILMAAVNVQRFIKAWNIVSTMFWNGALILLCGWLCCIFITLSKVQTGTAGLFSLYCFFCMFMDSISRDNAVRLSGEFLYSEVSDISLLLIPKYLSATNA